MLGEGKTTELITANIDVGREIHVFRRIMDLDTSAQSVCLKSDGCSVPKSSSKLYLDEYYSTQSNEEDKKKEKRPDLVIISMIMKVEQYLTSNNAGYSMWSQV